MGLFLGFLCCSSDLCVLSVFLIVPYYFGYCSFVVWGFPGGSEVKVSAWNVGDPGSIPGLGRFPGEGNGNPLQYSCLEHPMKGEAWWATVQGSQKQPGVRKCSSCLVLSQIVWTIQVLNDLF